MQLNGENTGQAIPLKRLVRPSWELAYELQIPSAIYEYINHRTQVETRNEAYRKEKIRS